MVCFSSKHIKLILVTVVLSAAILALMAGSYQADPFMASAVQNPPFTSLTYGIQTFLWWDKSAASFNLDMVRLMVFSHVKQIFAWKDLEPKPGEWNFTRADDVVAEVEAKGLKLVARLSDSPEWAYPGATGKKGVDFVDAPPDDLADFANYCGALAARYRGRIAAYQVWNEPNLSREWGGQSPDAAGYVGILQACSEAIHAADPQAIVISAGLAPTGTWDNTATPDDAFFEAMYDAGFQHYADVAGVNAPGYNFPPEISPEEALNRGGQRFGTFRRVEDLRQIMVARRDAARQMAILEMGWTTDPINPNYSWFAVTDEEKADYFVRAYQYAALHWRPWMGLMTAIYIPDPAWGPDREEFWWGITFDKRGRGGQAFVALANMAKHCGERFIAERAGNSPEALGLATVVPCA
jgi:hypothetical protein